VDFSRASSGFGVNAHKAGARLLLAKRDAQAVSRLPLRWCHHNRTPRFAQSGCLQADVDTASSTQSVRLADRHRSGRRLGPRVDDHGETPLGTDGSGRGGRRDRPRLGFRGCSPRRRCCRREAFGSQRPAITAVPPSGVCAGSSGCQVKKFQDEPRWCWDSGLPSDLLRPGCPRIAAGAAGGTSRSNPDARSDAYPAPHKNAVSEMDGEVPQLSAITAISPKPPGPRGSAGRGPSRVPGANRPQTAAQLAQRGAMKHHQTQYSGTRLFRLASGRLWPWLYRIGARQAQRTPAVSQHSSQGRSTKRVPMGLPAPRVPSGSGAGAARSGVLNAPLPAAALPN